MADWKLPWQGGCLCGEVRFRITTAPLMTMACHCTGCQKLSASAFSTSIAIPSEGFAVTQRSPVIGGLHGPHRQNYCPRCKNWVFTNPLGMEAFVNVRATMLDDHAWFVPFIETFTAEKLPWARTPAVHSYEQFPPLEAFAALMGAFARDCAGPR